MKKRLLVVGNGMAADRFLDDLLARGGSERFEITVVGEEQGTAYNRILLAKVLAGAEPDAITTKTADWYADNGITLISGRWVQRLDTTAKVAHIGNAETVPYDVAVFATGSAAFVPPIAGVYDEHAPHAPFEHRRFVPGIHVFRSMEDVLGIRAEADGAPRDVAVIGGGLLGLEAAKALADAGHRTSLIHLFDTLLDTQLDTIGGMLLRRAVDALDIQVVTGKTANVLSKEHVEAVVMADGRIVPAETLVFATGVRPRIDSAISSHLETARAIVVDERLQTSAPDVYAIGECAEFEGVTYGLVSPGWDHAEILAANLCGGDARYAGSPVSSRLKVAGLEVASMGLLDAELDTDSVVQVVEERRGVYRKLIVRDGRLAGAMLVGDPDTAPLVMQMFDRGTEVPANPVDIFCSVTAYSPAAVAGDVCNCNRVGEEELVTAIHNGCRTLDDLKGETRAGTGCGSCVGSLSKLLAQHAPQPESATAAA